MSQPPESNYSPSPGQSLSQASWYHQETSRVACWECQAPSADTQVPMLLPQVSRQQPGVDEVPRPQAAVALHLLLGVFFTDADRVSPLSAPQDEVRTWDPGECSATPLLCAQVFGDMGLQPPRSFCCPLHFLSGHKVHEGFGHPETPAQRVPTSPAGIIVQESGL